MDFYTIVADINEKSGDVTVFPDFLVCRSKDLMVRGRAFYAIWDEEAGLWSTDEYDVMRLVDADMRAYVAHHYPDRPVKVKWLRSNNSKSWYSFKLYLSNLSDNYKQLDETLTFANQDVKRSDYASRKLPYPLASGDYSAWDELVGTLYSVEERAKIEWAIGAIVSGDSKKIQKFLVLYGLAGTGKSTILNIIGKLFEGYTVSFEAKALGSNNNQFATEAFKSNPLVAIQHDGDLSRIEDNTKLNSIIAHEPMTMNEKYKSSYTSRILAFLCMGTNQPVKISDAKSGIIRRLIDVQPTGVILPANHYHTLMSQIDFELGAIAQHCLDVYLSMGMNYYNSYRPTEMMFQTDITFNFIEAHYDVFKAQDGVSLRQAYSLYKEFCSDTGIDRPLPQYKFREELRNYFDTFKDRCELNGEVVRSYYVGFNAAKFKAPVKDERTFSLVIEEKTSLLDEVLADQPAQPATDAGIPKTSWSRVKTTLSEIDTKTEHYVRVPQNHIVIDFDLKDEKGEKSLERNLEAATAWPPTYAELSKSGAGVHLHYIYEGDPTELSPIFSEGIEVKVFTGKTALRRKVSKCNAVPIASINSGLPTKEKKVLPADTIQTERGLRELISRNLKKEIHVGTKPSIDFIKKILDDAHASGMVYDVLDLRPRIIAFANNSTNQAMACLKMVQQMKFQGKETTSVEPERQPNMIRDERLVFFDCEVFPNLFLICWKYEDDDTITPMINPSPEAVESLFRFKLVGFNNRRFDNHMLYAASLGYNNRQLYELGQKLIDNGESRNASFASAYDLSYTDVYDFSSIKQSLKKFEIELGIPHMELGHPWDEPVPEDKWEEVVKYCGNDVRATEATFKARMQDFVARQILADLSGLTVNDTTAKHTARIIFEGDRNAAQQFVYTDLSHEFPGYKFDMGKSTYRDVTVGEGGYVFAVEGAYRDVAVLDVASMHPTSMIHMNMFGPYTKNYKDLKDARVAIKRGQYDEARKMLGGKLAPYLEDDSQAKDLSYALKIVINIVYGLTSAKFDNPFRDRRNKDNIAAKRGALFMIDVQNAIMEKGYDVVHIKTDSVKIADADEAIIEYVQRFAESYGYEFEHETTYDAFCLVNDAVYVARTGSGRDAKWSAVGAQFQHPYVFKTLFTGEDVTPHDLEETKQVSKGHMVLDFPTGPHFVGRTGRFVPVTEASGVGAPLVRVFDGKSYAVTGTKGHLWIEAEMARQLGLELEVDMTYFENLTQKAMDQIDLYMPFDEFVGNNP